MKNKATASELEEERESGGEWNFEDFKNFQPEALKFSAIIREDQANYLMLQNRKDYYEMT